MNEMYEYGCNPSDEIYATQDDFGPLVQAAEQEEELPFHIPRD